jgi:microsomal dipeptidase-like Zn-dependent dipeptidase
MSQGFADVHNHQFASLGFGGRAFWGQPYGDLSAALQWCTKAHGPGGTADIIGNLLRTVGYGGNIAGALGHRVGGYPQFDGWPRWDSLTHQSVHEEWLRRAVDGGLRLMVMLAVNNEGIAHMAKSLRGFPLDDMGAVDLQLQAARDMQDSIDSRSGGPGTGWYRIVETPQQARHAITAGKLAVVLGIEVDYLFDCRSPDSMDEAELLRRLDAYYERGVRHLFPIHFADNGFGGTAFQNNLERSREGWTNPAINPVSTLASGLYDINTEPADSYEYRTGRRNVRGLTDLGRALIHGMVERGMIIDVDHMSWKSREEVLSICEQLDYPVNSGHTGFTEISHGGKKHEGQLTPEEVRRITNLGGMVSVIPAQGGKDDIDTWQGSETVIHHTCGGTSQSTAQAYLYAVSNTGGRPVGFGTDFNGFAGLPGPRFGRDECHLGGSNSSPGLSYPFLARAGGATMDKSRVGKKTFDFNHDGLAHVGMLPDLIADFEAMGMTAEELGPILSSANGYVDLWEKATGRPPGMMPGAAYLLRIPSGASSISTGSRMASLDAMAGIRYALGAS